MKTLVEKLGFAPADEEKLLGKLQLWREHGKIAVQKFWSYSIQRSACGSQE